MRRLEAVRMGQMARVLVLAGIVLPFVDVPLTYFFGTLHSDYSRVSQFMSELAETGRPYSGLVRAWFTVASLVLAGFGVGMAGLLRRSRAAMVGLSLYLLWAVLGVAAALFPCDPGCKGETFSGWMHRLLGEISTACILPVPTLIWMGVRKNPEWRGFGWLAIPIQVLIVLVTLALAAGFYGTSIAGVALRNTTGLFQWMWWLVFYSWIVALGIQLLRAGAPATDN
jgi:Protein of unknown function (DUF998)